MNDPQPAPTKHCHACAVLLDARAEICPRCGVRQAVAPTKSHAVTWFLYMLGVITFVLVLYAITKNGG